MAYLEQVMNVLYENEINCRIQSFWDGGWDVFLGDKQNGYKVQATIDTLQEAADWLIEQAAIYHPGMLQKFKKIKMKNV